MDKTITLLKERLLFSQCTNEELLSNMMEKGQVTFYVGIDPTFKSLHIGHVLALITLKYLCDAGHKGIILIGGGTARIGDPSGKTSSRKILSYEDLDANAESIIKQIKSFLKVKDGSLTYLNNKEWLENLNYIDFLRDIGSHFSVNKMLSFESYKMRLENGLSFLEFNYQLLQSYDFLELNRRYGVMAQLGGDEQWGNMVAGADLIRRKGGEQVEAFTIPILTKADGQKMGKTEDGALFLDADIVSPYKFFQYWRNVEDSEVKKYLLKLTFLSIEEIESLILQNINEAKQRLAYEITLFIHGKKNADNAVEATKVAFGKSENRDAMPTSYLNIKDLQDELAVVDLFFLASLANSKSEARRLIEQGGAFLEGKEVKDVKMMVSKDMLGGEGIVLRAGKKRIVRLIAK